MDLQHDLRRKRCSHSGGQPTGGKDKAPESRALGFEEPGQLGALFLADAPQLERMTDGVEPLVDDFPQRLSHRR